MEVAGNAYVVFQFYYVIYWIRIADKIRRKI